MEGQELGLSSNYTDKAKRSALVLPIEHPTQIPEPSAMPLIHLQSTLITSTNTQQYLILHTSIQAPTPQLYSP